MADVALSKEEYVPPPAEVEDVESWWTKYVFCQEAKIIPQNQPPAPRPA